MRADISAVKAAMPKVLHDVAARAVQVHGSLGVSDEMPLAAMVLESFHMGLADGATEVHQITLARQILKQYKGTDGPLPDHAPAPACGPPPRRSTPTRWPATAARRSATERMTTDCSPARRCSSPGRREASARRSPAPASAHGAHVVLTDVLEDELAATTAELGEAATAHRLDVADPRAWDALADELLATSGRPDALVNNAGIVRAASLLETEYEDLQRTLAVNVGGTFLGMQTFVRPAPGVGHVDAGLDRQHVVGPRPDRRRPAP